LSQAGKKDQPRGDEQPAQVNQSSIHTVVIPDAMERCKQRQLHAGRVNLSPGAIAANANLVVREGMMHCQHAESGRLPSVTRLQ
jgi:hypothetical protein